MLLATEAMPQKSGLTLIVEVTFLIFGAGLRGLRAVVARGARVTVPEPKIECHMRLSSNPQWNILLANSKLRFAVTAFSSA